MKLKRSPATFPKADGEEPRTVFERAPFRAEDVVLDVTILSNEWASIIATVSAHGECNGGWQRALDFHTPPYPGDEEAVRRSGLEIPLCSCVGRGSDDAHKDECAFWQFVLKIRNSWPGSK